MWKRGIEDEKWIVITNNIFLELQTLIGLFQVVWWAIWKSSSNSNFIVASVTVCILGVKMKVWFKTLHEKPFNNRSILRISFFARWVCIIFVFSYATSPSVR